MLIGRGAGYTFGASIVKKFLGLNGMNHVRRAHQLCMEGYSVLYGDQLSTVWSAPNYCYRYSETVASNTDHRCGNMASILEVSPGGRRYFNVFEAAPENEVSREILECNKLIPARWASSATDKHKGDRVFPVAIRFVWHH